jgi:hypothetical protein
MAEFAITKTLEELKALFSQMKNVYFIATANQALNALKGADMELPVLDEGVTFDTGAADVSKIKLTTGAIWTSVATAGDADIQFQVASIAGEVNELLMNKVVESATFNGKTYEGAGYNTEPKKVTGALFMTSEDGSTALYLPNIEGYSNLISERGKPAYFNVAVSPMNDKNKASIYILKEKDTVAPGG